VVCVGCGLWCVWVGGGGLPSPPVGIENVFAVRRGVSASHRGSRMFSVLVGWGCVV
jgi:hypothetical protein